MATAPALPAGLTITPSIAELNAVDAPPIFQQKITFTLSDDLAPRCTVYNPLDTTKPLDGSMSITGSMGKAKAKLREYHGRTRMTDGAATSENELQAFLEGIIEKIWGLNNDQSNLIERKGQLKLTSDVLLSAPWIQLPEVNRFKERKAAAQPQAASKLSSSVDKRASGAFEPDISIVCHTPGPRVDNRPETDQRIPYTFGAVAELKNLKVNDPPHYKLNATATCFFRAAWYLVITARETGCRLGIAIVNRRFQRFFMHDIDTVVVETLSDFDTTSSTQHQASPQPDSHPTNTVRNQRTEESMLFRQIGLPIPANHSAFKMPNTLWSDEDAAITTDDWQTNESVRRFFRFFSAAVLMAGMAQGPPVGRYTELPTLVGFDFSLPQDDLAEKSFRPEGSSNMSSEPLQPIAPASPEPSSSNSQQPHISGSLPNNHRYQSYAVPGDDAYILSVANRASEEPQDDKWSGLGLQIRGRASAKDTASNATSRSKRSASEASQISSGTKKSRTTSRSTPMQSPANSARSSRHGTRGAASATPSTSASKSRRRPSVGRRAISEQGRPLSSHPTTLSNSDIASSQHSPVQQVSDMDPTSQRNDRQGGPPKISTGNLATSQGLETPANVPMQAPSDESFANSSYGSEIEVPRGGGGGAQDRYSLWHDHALEPESPVGGSPANVRPESPPLFEMGDNSLDHVPLTDRSFDLPAFLDRSPSIFARARTRAWVEGRDPSPSDDLSDDESLADPYLPPIDQDSSLNFEYPDLDINGSDTDSVTTTASACQHENETIQHTLQELGIRILAVSPQTMDNILEEATRSIIADPARSARFDDAGELAHNVPKQEESQSATQHRFTALYNLGLTARDQATANRRSAAPTDVEDVGGLEVQLRNPSDGSSGSRFTGHSQIIDDRDKSSLFSGDTSGSEINIISRGGDSKHHVQQQLQRYKDSHDNTRDSHDDTRS